MFNTHCTLLFLTDMEYKRKRWYEKEEDLSVQGLRWDGASLRQVKKKFIFIKQIILEHEKLS